MPATASPPSGFFDRWSSSYDSARLQTLTYRPIHDALLRSLRTCQPRTILDLGCGTGQFLARLDQQFPDAAAHGLDLSPGMLAEAMTRASGGLVLGDAQALPFGTDSFDAVTCSESFHWYPDQRQSLREVAAVLRPGGQLLIASIAAATDVGDVAMRRLSMLTGQPLRPLTPRRVAALLEQTGFSVERQRRIPRLGLIPWPVLTEATRRRSARD